MMKLPIEVENLGKLAAKRELEATNPRLSEAERSRLLWLAREYRDAQTTALLNLETETHCNG